MATRNISNTPLNKVEEWSCSEDGSVNIRLSSGNRNVVAIEAKEDNNVLIMMKRNSERSCTGIDRSRFASVELSTKTNPVYLIAGALAILSSLYFWDWYCPGWSITMMLVGATMILAYFMTKVGRLNIRVAEDVDYRILLKASAVPSPKEMKMLVSALMMASPTGETQSDRAQLVVSQTPMMIQATSQQPVDDGNMAIM